MGKLHRSALILICFWLLAGCASQPSPPPGAIKITSNPQYDAKIAKRIEKNWREALNTTALDYYTGTVVVSFVLHSDGAVSDIRLTKNNVGYIPGWICVKAIVKSAPFPKWTPEMVQKLGKNYCDVDFTFNYQGQ